MVLLRYVRLGSPVLCTLAIVACGSRLKIDKPSLTPVRPTPAAAATQTVAAPQTAGPAVEPPQPVEDPVAALIAASDSHFKAGQRELERGHHDAARQEFDQAVNILLESPYGGRTEPRIRDHFDRLIARISAYELKAIAEGDGFAEKTYEAATIDELLALSRTFGTPPPAKELETRVESDLAAQEHDIEIPLNRRVLAYIQLFQGRLHDFIEEGLRRGSKYLPMIQSVFRAEGLPLDLAYVPLIESAFNPNALSRAKAKGVWQFMSGTAAENGLRRDWYIDERSDPAKATAAAARYLKTLSNLFSGDWHLVLASYNGGPGRLQRAIKRTGIENFWALAEKPNLLPRETREYVPMILAAIVIARNPAQYGFEFQPEEPPAYEEITVSRPIDLRRIAEWAGTTIEAIQALNPELRRWTTPVRDEQYQLKVPAGTAEVVKARLQETPPVELASLKWYTVKRGETLAAIARKLNVGRTDLAEANYLPVTAKLTPGQKLIVPREATVLLAARTERPVPLAESRPIKSPAPIVAQAAASSDQVRLVYLVRKGDTLSSIAAAFRTNVASLRAWNRLQDNHIAAGDRLVVYTRRAAPAD